MRFLVFGALGRQFNRVDSKRWPFDPIGIALLRDDYLADFRPLDARYFVRTLACHHQQLDNGSVVIVT